MPVLVLLFVQLKTSDSLLLVKSMIFTWTPVQTVTFGKRSTTGGGLTVIEVMAVGSPLHPFAVGVMVIVAVTGSAKKFTALNALIFPLPFPPIPIVEFEDVQPEKVVFGTGPLKIIALVSPPLQTICGEIRLAVGFGRTVIEETTVGIPKQPSNSGVTVINPVRMVSPGFAEVMEGIGFWVPEAARPIEGLELLHVNVVPDKSDPRKIEFVGSPSHTDCTCSINTTGDNFTTIEVTVVNAPAQPFAEGTIFIAAVTSELKGFDT